MRLIRFISSPQRSELGLRSRSMASPLRKMVDALSALPRMTWQIPSISKSAGSAWTLTSSVSAGTAARWASIIRGEGGCGAFFEATDTRSLALSFHAILDALERSKIADRGVVYGEVFPQYLWPALILAALDLLLGLFVLRRTP